MLGAKITGLWTLQKIIEDLKREILSVPTLTPKYQKRITQMMGDSTSLVMLYYC